MIEFYPFAQQWIAQIESLIVPLGPRVRNWEKRFLAKHNTQSLCSYCGAPIARSPDQTHGKWRVDFIIPVHLGGAHHLQNMVLCCSSCLNKKKGRDWIEWGAGPTLKDQSRLAQNRLESLEESQNHVIPLTAGRAASPRKGAKKFIAMRWAHPRFKVYATVTKTEGWFAIPSIHKVLRLPLQTRLFLKHLMACNSGFRIDHKGWRIYRVPFLHFHSIAFQMIERNALLIEVGHSHNPYSLEPEHYRRWFILLNGYEWIQDVVDAANEQKLIRKYYRRKAEKDVPRVCVEEQRQVEIMKNRKNKRREFDV